MPTIDFLWDEWSDNVLQETDENNVVTTYFQRPEKYGEVLYHKAGSRFSFYHFDGNGSTRKLTNVSQSTIKTFIFSGFGEIVASSGTGSTPFAYKGAAGYYTNPVTNDIYVRVRMYEPTTGRWLSKDPLGFVDGPNLFGAYFVPCGLDFTGSSINCAGKCPQIHDGNMEQQVSWYGCFCGAGNGTGPEGNKPPGDDGVIDGVDLCCFYHDECYTLNHCKSFPRLPEDESAACERCDNVFCRCLTLFRCNRYPFSSREHANCVRFVNKALAWFRCERFGRKRVSRRDIGGFGKYR